MSRVRCGVVLALAFWAVAMISAAEAQAQRSGGRGYGAWRGSFLGLLRVEEVQKELKLNEDQIGKIREIGQKLRAEMREQFAGLREIEDRQERRTKATELGNQLDEKARGKIREVLSGEQMIRLYQVRLQVRGTVYGLNHPWVAERLKLTDEQKKKAADLDKTTREKTSEAFSGLRDLSAEARREKFAEVLQKVRKIRADANEQALGLLNAEQKEQFEGFKGEKFELPSRRGRS